MGRPTSQDLALVIAWGDDRAFLKLALDFAQDADSIPRIRKQFDALLDGPGPSRQRLIALRSAVRTMLEDLARDGAAEYNRRLTTIDLRGMVALRRDRSRRSGYSTFVAANTDAMSFRDRFLWRLAQAVMNIGVEKILICKAPRANSVEPCSRLFLKQTQDKYCSRRCKRRLAMRHWREGQKTADEESLRQARGE